MNNYKEANRETKLELENYNMNIRVYCSLWNRLNYDNKWEKSTLIFRRAQSVMMKIEY